MCGESCAQKYNISRQDQDAYAIESYTRAAAAAAAGKFDAEIVPVSIPSLKKKGTTIVRYNGCSTRIWAPYPDTYTLYLASISRLTTHSQLLSGCTVTSKSIRVSYFVSWCIFNGSNAHVLLAMSLHLIMLRYGFSFIFVSWILFKLWMEDSILSETVLIF